MTVRGRAIVGPAVRLLAVALLAAVVAGVGATGARTHELRVGALALPANAGKLTLVQKGQQAPPDSFCRALIGVPCYSPQEIQHAYNVDSLLNAGWNGAGQSIVIIDSFGSPTIANDLKVFDADFGLPDPPSFKVLSPLGTVPFDPSNNDMVGWAAETTLDVEWAHAMAPNASIVLLTSPVSETEGVQGMPQFLALEQYALDNHLGQIISQSWGATENTLFDPAGQQVFTNFEALYARAAAQKVTVLASAGDTGSTNAELNGVDLYPFPVVGFPASSPLVTAVGGTSLTADTSGNYQSEVVWDGNGATGGGVSQVFTEPAYQLTLPRGAQATLHGHRGIPDISWNADPDTPILVYLSFLGPDAAGYYLFGGTSEGSPQLAGVVADLNQLLGHPIGFLNPYLYALGPLNNFTGVYHDITVGNNGFAGVPGYPATPGWDASTGEGTPNVGRLVRAIALLAR
jgi:subtilase family serine protease